jgi:hypothetical protein
MERGFTLIERIKNGFKILGCAKRQAERTTSIDPGVLLSKMLAFFPIRFLSAQSA